MSAADNYALHVRWAEAENTHDVTVERWSEFVHDDVVVHHMDGIVVTGIEDMVKNLVDSIAAMPDWKNTIDDRAATDDRVTCRWRINGTPADTGEPIEVAGISFWTFEDGKVREGWVCSNAAHLSQQGVRAAGSFAIDAHPDYQ